MTSKFLTMLTIGLCVSSLSASAQTSEQKLLFQKVHKILEQHCFGCHGPDKQKGGLRLDSLEAMLKGSKKSDNVVVAGHADQSELVYRIRLPIADDDVMPPAKKDRLSTQEILTLIQWVDNGASWGDEVTAGEDMEMSAADVAELHKPMGVNLTKSMSPKEETWFRNNIEQLLVNHCVGCHGPQKQKGDLRLDSMKMILAGGDNGPVLVPGDPDKSELFARMLLPEDDEDVMPPEEKSRVPKAKLEAMRKWISEGAHFPPPKSKLARGGDNHYTRFFSALVGTDKANVEWLQERGVFIEPLIWDGGGLRVLFSHASVPLDASVLDRLKTWNPEIRWLDLANAQITPEVMDYVNALDGLLVLHFERSTITDVLFKRLKTSSRIEYLNLHSTSITDASIPVLKQLPALRKLYLWNTKIQADAVKRLAQKEKLKVVYK